MLTTATTRSVCQMEGAWAKLGRPSGSEATHTPLCAVGCEVLGCNCWFKCEQNDILYQEKKDHLVKKIFPKVRCAFLVFRFCCVAVLSALARARAGRRDTVICAVGASNNAQSQSTSRRQLRVRQQLRFLCCCQLVIETKTLDNRVFSSTFRRFRQRNGARKRLLKLR